MKILITGGNGSIGRRLADKLRAEKHEVVSYDLVDGKDLLDRETLDKEIEGVDVVFHLAAVADLNWARVHPYETLEINVKGTYNVAFSCLQHKKPVYYASTCCVYGNQEYHPDNEKTLPNPSEVYAYTKLAGEEVIKGLAVSYGLEYNIIRFATIYGPDMRPAMGVHVFMGQALRNEPITIHGDGVQTRTLTYVDDLVDGVVAIFNSGVMNETINVSTEESVSALDMANKIKKLTNSKSEITFIEQRPGQTTIEEICAIKALEMCNWQAKTTFDEGLAKTLDWFIKTNQIEKR